MLCLTSWTILCYIIVRLFFYFCKEFTLPELFSGKALCHNISIKFLLLFLMKSHAKNLLVYKKLKLSYAEFSSNVSTNTPLAYVILTLTVPSLPKLLIKIKLM